MKRLRAPVPIRVRRVIVAGLCAAVVAVGIAATTTAFGGAAAPKPIWPPTRLTDISGGTASEQALLRQVVAGMQPSVIKKIEITGSGNDVGPAFHRAS